jgi:Zn-dependent protease
MNWSFRLCRIFGIEVRIHYIFPVFVGFIVFQELFRGGVGGGLFMLILLLTIFAIVLIHELAHSLTARYYAIPVRSITLWPLGGVAMMVGLPQSPYKELRIAVAGPLANFIMAGILLPLVLLLAVGEDLFRFSSVGSNLLGALLAVNVIMGLFNLLPAFPLDGGRIYRAILARRRDYLEATTKAVRLGRHIAIGLGCVGLLSALNIIQWGGGWFLLIALFLYWAGKREEAAVRRQYFFQNFRGPSVHFDPGPDAREERERRQREMLRAFRDLMNGR